MRLLLVALVLLSVRSADAAPSIKTKMVDLYEIEERSAGDGAPLVVVGKEVPEPLFITSSRRALMVWWRARHDCGHFIVPRVRVEKPRTLVLAVDPVPGVQPCEEAATVMETRIKKPRTGVWQMRFEGEGPRLAPLFFTVPAAARPADFDNLQRRVPELKALRRIGEGVAWTYHAEVQTKPAMAAYRWLIGLDELHWRTPLYYARIFGNTATTRGRATAVTALEAMMVGVRRLREELAAPDVRALGSKERELENLRAWLRPTLIYFANRWHNGALTRFRPARICYESWLELFGDEEKDAPEMRYFYAALLMKEGDDLIAQREMARAAEGLEDPEMKKMATACTVALAMEGKPDDVLLPCRRIRPPFPPLDQLPDIDDERFARPVRDEER